MKVRTTHPYIQKNKHTIALSTGQKKVAFNKEGYLETSLEDAEIEELVEKFSKVMNLVSELEKPTKELESGESVLEITEEALTRKTVKDLKEIAELAGLKPSDDVKKKSDWVSFLLFNKETVEKILA